MGTAKQAVELRARSRWLPTGLLLGSGPSWWSLLLLQLVCSALTALRGAWPEAGTLVSLALALGAWACDTPEGMLLALKGHARLLLPGIVVYGHQVVFRAVHARATSTTKLWRASQLVLATVYLSCFSSRPMASSAGLFWLTLHTAEHAERILSGCHVCASDAARAVAF